MWCSRICTGLRPATSTLFCQWIFWALPISRYRKSQLCLCLLPAASRICVICKSHKDGSFWSWSASCEVHISCNPQLSKWSAFLKLCRLGKRKLSIGDHLWRTGSHRGQSWFCRGQRSRRESRVGSGRQAGCTSSQPSRVGSFLWSACLCAYRER